METLKLNLLQKAMQTYSWRMQAHTSNIANLDTPGYQRLAVSFEEELQQVMHSVPGPRDLSDIRPRMEVQDSPPLLEDELMELADTQMRTQLSTRALRDHFELMRTGITGRSG